ncbi:MAG: LLM class flavin-dependent oxidoreductase [Acidimicrobiia bacterium]|nr:LLM class flavin-dependent oxidoreductase [Acidimicrobiia bacterium]
MIEIGVFHNGASDLPVKVTADGVAINVGDLAATQESAARVQVAQIRQGVLADRLGFDYFFMTEHHFQPEGAEYSPNPLQSETAIAALTKRIRFGQAANILTWHHPVRIAEQAAMLDVISGGRLEFGMGRGYQPRETEVLGGQLGATIQDQERNRAFFEEAYEIIMKCWTQDSFSHHGEFFTLPPSYTRWNHQQTIAYFSEPGNGRSLEDVIAVGAPDMYSQGSPVLATTTKLRELQVYPQPLQKPHPQVWEPLTSPRSIKFAAQNGVNGYFIVEPKSRLRQNIELYYEEAEKAGWPDRLDRGPFKFGWDAEKRRGIITGRYVHIADKGIGDLDRAARSLEVQWDYYGPFGFAGVLADAGEEVDMMRKVTAQELRDRGVALHGSVDYVIEEILSLKTSCGYEDFLFNAWFEHGGFTTNEIEDQMLCFAEEVMPVLRRECGGSPEKPESVVELVPEVRRMPAGVGGAA